MKILNEQYIRENYEQLINDQVSYKFEDVNRMISRFYQIRYNLDRYLNHQKLKEININQIDSKTIKRLRENGLLDLIDQEIDEFSKRLKIGDLNDILPSSIDSSQILEEDLKNLKILNLINKGIEKISNDAFNGLSNLKELSLRSNQIEIIDSNTFEGLDNLEILDLSV